MIERRIIAWIALLTTSCAGPSRETLGREVWAEVKERAAVAGDAPPSERRALALDNPLTADDAVRIALERSPQVGVAMATLGLSRAMLSEARISNPTAGAAVLFRDREDPVIELELTQSLTDILYLAADRAALGADLESAKLDAANEISSFALEVRTRFIEHQADIQALELSRSVLLAAEASHAAAEALHHAGNITDLRYYAERDVLERARLETQRVATRVATGHEELTALLGLWGADTRWSAAARLDDPPAEKLVLADLERDAIDKSLALAAYRHRIAAFGTRANRARWAAAFPNIEVGAAAHREEADHWQVGPRLEIALPLFDQGQGAVAQVDARQSLEERRYELEAIRLRGEVRAAAAEVMANADRARHLREVVLPLRGKIVEETEAHVNAMTADIFGLMQAKRDQIQAAREYIEALREFWVSHAHVRQLRAGGKAMRRGDDGRSADVESITAAEGGRGEEH